MKKDDDKEIIKLTAQKLLLAILKMGTPFFRASNIYRYSALSLANEIDVVQDEISNKIKYLKSMGYIKKYSENKKEYIELTPKGLDRIKKIQASKIQIPRPKNWDGQWRIVIWDIPRKESQKRDEFRRVVVRSGFLRIQDSVYVYPFPCTKEIEQMTVKLGIMEYVEIFIAKAIISEEKLIKRFLVLKILNTSDIKSV